MQSAPTVQSAPTPVAKPPSQLSDSAATATAAADTAAKERRDKFIAEQISFRVKQAEASDRNWLPRGRNLTQGQIDAQIRANTPQYEAAARAEVENRIATCANSTSDWCKGWK